VSVSTLGPLPGLTVAPAPYAGLRLVAGAVATPALVSHVRPALVLPERETRAVLSAVAGDEASRGGTLTAGASGVQVWSGPWDEAGIPGSAVQLGAVDWTCDARNHATISRVMVTAAGLAAGHSPASILHRVLRAAGLAADPARIGTPRPPARDPFHSRHR